MKIIAYEERMGSSPNHDHIREIENTDPSTIDLDTAERYARILLAETHKIEAALGRRRRVHESDPNANEQDYQDWRRRTSAVLNKLLESYRKFKAHCREQRQQQIIDGGNFNPNSPGSLLKASRELLHRFRDDGVEFEDDEMAVLVGLDRYLDKNPQP